MALVALFMPCFVLAMWLGVLLGSWAAAPLVVAAAIAFAWMRAVTSRDDHRLAQQWLRLQLALRNPNRKLRGGVRSYAPLELRGGSIARRP